jgi:hypothetical protein
VSSGKEHQTAGESSPRSSSSSLSSAPAGSGGPRAGGAEGGQAPAGAGDEQRRPSEEELRAAYEAEMSRISSAELILQATVSLLNIGGYRMGLASSATAATGAGGASSADPGSRPSSTGQRARELEQVRDAIDGARALLPLLERGRSAGELRPLRDALSQLQLAYAREAPAATPAGGAPSADTRPAPASQAPGGEREPGERKPGERGPAEASGKLWVPGR